MIVRKRKLRGPRWAAGVRRRWAAKVRRARGAPLVHKFKEMYDGGWTTVPATSISNSVLSTQIASLTNFPSLQSMFDLYKITGMKVTFIPSHNVSDISAGAGTGIPMLYVAPNRDPYVPAPASVADILNDDGCKAIRFTKPVSFYVKNPKGLILDSAGNSLPFQFDSSKAYLQPWLTTGGNSQTINQSTVKHYGLRYLLDNTLNTAQPFVFQVIVKLYFSCKEQD